VPDDEQQSERRWVVEPPGLGEVKLHLAFGEGAKLTEEQEAAVGALLRSLKATDPEVTGHTLPKCPKQSCTCVPLRKNNLSGEGTDPWNLMGSFTVLR
jgi:hypothetical protein